MKKLLLILLPCVLMGANSVITSPTPGTTIPNTVTVTWTASYTNAIYYLFASSIGCTQYEKANINTYNTSAQLSFGGYTGTIYVTLYSRANQSYDPLVPTCYTYTVGAALPSTTMTLGSGGSGVAFTHRYTASDGVSYSNIWYTWISIRGDQGFAGAGACSFVFDRTNNRVILLDDAGNWSNNVAMGSATPIQNSQCQINPADTYQFGGGGNTAGFNISGIFYPSFVGAKYIAGFSVNNAGQNLPIAQIGTWTINPTELTITPLHALPGQLTIDDTDGVSQVPIPSSNDQFLMVNLRGGKQHKVYRADKVTIKKFESSRQPVGDGWTYTYKIACPDCMLFRIATTDDNAMLDASKLSASSKAWISAYSFWSANPDTGVYPADGDEFQIDSKWSPGLMPMYFVNHEAEKNYALPYSGKDASTVLAASNIFVNSKIKFVIGPAIKPGATKEELLAMVGRWASDYGFSWLQPLVDAKSLDGLYSLEVPDDALSLDIVACLKGVMPKQ